MTRLRRAAIAVTCAACVAPASATAATSESWVVTSDRTVAPYYRQGLASDAVGNVFFSGSFAGIYRTRNLVEKRQNIAPIPPGVALTEQYNHIGDIAYDAGEGGRLLVPLESFVPFGPDQNPSKTGSVAVMDPVTLQWRYYVKLDPAEIAKAQWVAADPARGLLWTISGSDLLAYRLADINPANAAPAGPVIHSVQRLPGAALGGAAGAAVVGGRIYLSTSGPGGVRIVSIDPATGASRVEAEMPGPFEPEGMDAGPYLGGLLHWQFVPGGGLSATRLLGLVPKGSALRIHLSRVRVRAGRRTAITVSVTVATSGFRIPLAGVRVTIAGRRAKTNDKGRATLRVTLKRGLHRSRASFKGLRSATKRVRAT